MLGTDGDGVSACACVCAGVGVCEALADELEAPEALRILAAKAPFVLGVRVLLPALLLLFSPIDCRVRCRVELPSGMTGFLDSEDVVGCGEGGSGLGDAVAMLGRWSLSAVLSLLLSLCMLDMMLGRVLVCIGTCSSRALLSRGRPVCG